MSKALRLSDLVGKQVTDEDGKSFGNVHEVRTKQSKVTFLICGKRGLLQRWAAFRTGTRIEWVRVKKLAGDSRLVIETGGAASG
jgi:sporulation protein YlmC with PRC-barrel domain